MQQCSATALLFEQSLIWHCAAYEASSRPAAQRICVAMGQKRDRPGCAGIAAFSHNCEHVLLIKPRTRQSLGAKNQPWALPKGGAMRGESPVQNALREFAEETHVDPGDLELWPTPPAIVHTQRGPITFYAAWCKAPICTKAQSSPAVSEIVFSQWHETASLDVMTGILVQSRHKSLIDGFRQQYWDSIDRIDASDATPPWTRSSSSSTCLVQQRSSPAEQQSSCPVALRRSPEASRSNAAGQQTQQPTSEQVPLQIREPDHPPPGFEADNDDLEQQAAKRLKAWTPRPKSDA